MSLSKIKKRNGELEDFSVVETYEAGSDLIKQLSVRGDK